MFGTGQISGRGRGGTADSVGVEAATLTGARRELGALATERRFLLPVCHPSLLFLFLLIILSMVSFVVFVWLFCLCIVGVDGRASVVSRRSRSQSRRRSCVRCRSMGRPTRRPRRVTGARDAVTVRLRTSLSVGGCRGSWEPRTPCGEERRAGDSVAVGIGAERRICKTSGRPEEHISARERGSSHLFLLVFYFCFLPCTVMPVSQCGAHHLQVCPSQVSVAVAFPANCKHNSSTHRMLSLSMVTYVGR